MDSFATGVGGKRGNALVDFQRNTAFAAFLLVVVSCLAFFLVKELRHVLVPVVWAIFCALPVQRAVHLLHHCGLVAVTFCLRPFRNAQWEEDQLAIPFRHVIGKNTVTLENSWHNRNVIAKVGNPLINCCRFQYCGAVDVTKKPSRWLSCCRRRIQILEIDDEANANPHQVNKLREEALYTIGSVDASEDGEDLQLKLFVAGRHNYPAVLDEEQLGPEVEVTGYLCVDKTSTISYLLATLVVLGLVSLGLTGFGGCVYWGALSLQSHLPAYITGVKDFIGFIDEHTKRLIGEESMRRFQEAIVTYLQSNGASLATYMLGSIEDFLTQALFFIIYLLFWLMEPIPVAESVGGIFKSYLFLKSVVCLLFASCFAGLLAALGCQIWPLYFVVTFVLNYIPEVGSFLVCALALPAVLFDGTVEPEAKRYYNTLILFVGFLAFKFVCGNIVEVRMYSNSGGEFMRMHPLVLTVLMFIFYEILGITGMFLAVPFVAMVKYYLVTSSIPPMLLHPILCFLEGDDMAAHIIYVDRTREKRKEVEQIKLRHATASTIFSERPPSLSATSDKTCQSSRAKGLPALSFSALSSDRLLGASAGASLARWAGPQEGGRSALQGAGRPGEPLVPESNKDTPALNESDEDEAPSLKASAVLSEAASSLFHSIVVAETVA